MIKWMILASLLFSQTLWADFPVRPDPNITAGDYCDRQDPDFREFRYAERIAFCKRNVSKSRKRNAYEAYNINLKCKSEYTVDHFIPLSMGGSNAPSNLWPEHKNVKATRLNLEEVVFEKLKNGEITHAEAIAEVVSAKMNPPAGIPQSGCR